MKKTGYERQKVNDTYYSTDVTGCTIKHFDFRAIENNDSYATANYYSDKTVAENNARADRLMRSLRRFAVENNEKEIDWKCGKQKKYYIYFNHTNDFVRVGEVDQQRDFGQIYFSSEKVAEKAIIAFYNELIWYFIEYCDHVVEDKGENNVGCELCKSHNLDIVGIIDNYICLYGGNSRPNDIEKIKFCPNCGRRLKGSEE